MSHSGTVLRVIPNIATTACFRQARRRPIDPAHQSARLRLTLVLVATVVLVGLILVASPAGAAEEEDVHFDGAGWGHGVGMSQWGAYAQALGWNTAPRTYDQILAYYYTGTSLEAYDSASSGHPNLWVNLEFDRTDLLLRVVKNGPSQVPATVTRAAESIDLTSNQSLRLIWADDNNCTVEFREGTNLATDPFETWDGGSCDLDIAWDGDTDGTPSTLVEIVGCTLFDWNGILGFRAPVAMGVARCTPSTIRATIPSSTGSIWYSTSTSTTTFSESPRSRTVGRPRHSKPRRSRPDPTLQKPSTGSPPSAGPAPATCTTPPAASATLDGATDGTTPWIDVVKATDNEVITHPAAPRNDVVSAVYTSSNGGASEAFNERWGGQPTPWVASVVDPFSLHPSNPNKSWTKTISAQSLATKVWGSSPPSLTSVKVIARNTSGSAKTIEFSASDGQTTTRSAAWVTNSVGLKSWYFDVALGAPPPRDEGFTDIGESVHKDDIEYLAGRDIALSCASGADRFCPDDPMAPRGHCRFPRQGPRPVVRRDRLLR